MIFIAFVALLNNVSQGQPKSRRNEVLLYERYKATPRRRLNAYMRKLLFLLSQFSLFQSDRFPVYLTGLCIYLFSMVKKASAPPLRRLPVSSARGSAFSVSEGQKYIDPRLRNAIVGKGTLIRMRTFYL